MHSFTFEYILLLGRSNQENCNYHSETCRIMVCQGQLRQPGQSHTDPRETLGASASLAEACCIIPGGIITGDNANEDIIVFRVVSSEQKADKQERL